MNDSNLSFQVYRASDDFKPAEDGYRAVLEGLGRNIINKIGDVDLGKDVRIFIRNEEKKVVGGAMGSVFGGWLYIPLMWVEESLRNRGYGTKLLEMMEKEVVKLGCRHAHVDTYSFEARPFYEKNGYTVFASLENYPEGHSKHFLKKKLLQ